MAEIFENALINRAKEIQSSRGDVEPLDLDGTVERHQGEIYVVLDNPQGLVAVYWLNINELELATNYPASFE